MRRRPAGRISFKRRAAAHDRREQRRAARDREIGPIDYPDSYASPARFIKNERTAFRDPAAPGDPRSSSGTASPARSGRGSDTGDAEVAYLTIVDPGGRLYRYKARPRGDRWSVTRKLRPREAAYVRAGDVRDDYGNYNGADSERLKGSAG